MLDFLDFLTDRFSLKAEMDGYFRRAANLNVEDCQYLLIMQNHKKMFQLESEIYLGLFSFFGTNGLKTFANYAKRYLEKHSSDNKEHTEYISAEIAKACEQKTKFGGWIILYRLLDSEKWKSAVDKTLDIDYALSFFLRLIISEGISPRLAAF